MVDEMSPMRTYGLLVNPVTLRLLRVIPVVAWPFRKLWCALIGHIPMVEDTPDGWIEECGVCGQKAQVRSVYL